MNIKKLISRLYLSNIPKIFRPTRTILGIETSCDDTACAIVTSERTILGECVKSYPDELFRLGGIVPTIAKQWHEESIDSVIHTALQRANLTMDNIDAIAITNRPGLVLSLLVGLKHSKKLCKEFRKPLIPIHHMEAHTLTSRLFNRDIEYPFLTLLISGGHCLIALVKSVNGFIILGRNTDDAPGEVLDKVARRLKLHNLSKYRLTAGGAAIEDVAKTGNIAAFEYAIPRRKDFDCNFSFSGFKSQAMRNIIKEEAKYEIEGDHILPNVNDFCASLQYCLVRHIVRQLQRAMEFIELQNMLPLKKRYLVVSGGSACNSYFQRALTFLCEAKNYQFSVPPANYCSDNGVMIAWNGIEKYNAGTDIFNPNEVDSLKAEHRCQFNGDLSEQIAALRIKCTWIKLEELHNITEETNAIEKDKYDFRTHEDEKIIMKKKDYS